MRDESKAAGQGTCQAVLLARTPASSPSPCCACVRVSLPVPLHRPPVPPPCPLLRPGGCLAGVHTGEQSLSALRVCVAPPFPYCPPSLSTPPSWRLSRWRTHRRAVPLRVLCARVCGTTGRGRHQGCPGVTEHFIEWRTGSRKKTCCKRLFCFLCLCYLAGTHAGKQAFSMLDCASVSTHVTHNTQTCCRTFWP